MSDMDWENLLTRPLSEAELKGYMAQLEGAEFQQMLHDYHAELALETSRKLIGAYLEAHCPPEVLLVVLGHLWLDGLARLESTISAEMIASWRTMPQMLAQVMLQHAVVVLTEYKDQLVQKDAPELAAMCAAWRRAMAGADAAQLADPVFQERAQRIHQAATAFQKKLENDLGLKLQPADFISIWNRLFLQLFLLMQGDEEPIFYYLLDQNWSTFLTTLPLLVDMMMVLRGMEHLLLPENRAALLEMVQRPEIAPYFAQYQNQN